jgi:ABC-2 type transport system permease protein
MNAEITTLDLSLRRKSTIGYSIGMAVYVLVIVALYPAFKDASSLDEMMNQSQAVAALFGISGSLTTPTGWLNANLWANFFPLLILLLTIGYGASCLAGQEHDGLLELVLSLPFPRAKVLGEKIAALVAQATTFCAVVLLASLAGLAFDMTFDLWHLATATLGVLLLGVDFGLLALLIGARTGDRGPAIAIAASVAAASYLVSSMAPLVSWLEPWRVLSLFYWSVGDNQLDAGLSPTAVAILLAVAIVLGVLSLITFERHDLD